LVGVINRTKAIAAGRNGQPLLQLYYDIAKLLRKDALYSRTTTWVFRTAPVIVLACPALALLFIPWGGAPATLTFTGDLVPAIYLLGTARFFTILAALDTGSAFEGMGASREAFFAALTEPILFMVLATLVRLTGALSFTTLYVSISPNLWVTAGEVLILETVTLFVVLLTENSRIPIDDPTTHLELTMIHEVMVLDHSGVDFAYILYGSAVKMWLFSALLAGLIVPVRTANVWLNGVAFLGGMFCVAVMVGVVESVMARLRLNRVPQMLVGAAAIAAMSIFLTLK